MTYLGYARRFRPGRFSEVVGQESVVLTLRHALEEGKVSHAYLFAGPRGVGKTTTARILAKALNCEKGPTPDPCGECVRCAEIAGGGSLDVVEIDAASHNSVESVRALREAAYNATHGSRFRLYILDEVHMLSTSAFNALLKILEEPPSHVKFVLCTTDPQKVPETVRSRCQRLDFRRIAIPQVIARLAQIAEREGIGVSGEALRGVALHVRGGMRDAEVLLEQLSVYADGDVTAEHVRALTGSVDETKLARLSGALAAGDAAAALGEADQILEGGTDTAELTDALVAHIWGALAVQACGESNTLVATRGIDVESAKSTASALTQEELLYAAAALQSARKEARVSEQPRILLELALVRLSRVKDLVSLEELAAQLKDGGTPAAAAPARGESGAAGGTRSRPSRSRSSRNDAPASPPRAARSGPSRPPSGAEASPFVADEDPASGSGSEEPALEAAAPLGPPPPPVEGDLTLETVRERWPQIRARVFDKSYPTGTMIKPASPAGVAGDTIRLTYPEGQAGYLKRLSSAPDRLALVESAASEIMGRPVRVSLASSSGDAGGAGGEADAPRPKPADAGRTPAADTLNDPGVRKVIDRFEGQIVRVDRAAGGSPEDETGGG